MTAVDVVIPTWNGRALLASCLEHLARQTLPATVIVVDNGSSDGTAELVRAEHPAVRVVALERNLGFGAAVNRGVAAGAGDFVVLVNNDVDCDPAFLERIVAPLVARAHVGAVAGLLLAPGRAVIDSYGIEADRTLAAYARCAGAPYPGTALHERGLLGPSGGAAAYRRVAFEAVGGFDEAFFAYLEDADLALRLRAAGWEVAGAPDAVGVHLGGASFGRRSGFQVAAAGASRAHLLRKYGVLRDPRTAAWALATEAGVIALDTLLERRATAARARLEGWRRARGARGPRVPPAAINPAIGVRESIRRRAGAVALAPGRAARRQPRAPS